MAIKTPTQLKSYFRKGMYPTESQFADVLDSYRHKSEKVDLSQVKGLADALNSKYNTTEAKIIEAKQKQQEADIDWLKTVQETQAEDIDELQESDKVQQAELETITGELAKVRELIKSGATLDEARVALLALGENYKTLYSVASTVKTFIEATDTKDKTINTWAEVENFLRGITDTTSLTALLKELEDKVTDAYQRDISGLQDNVRNISNDIIGVRGDIGGLQDNIDSIRENINGISEPVPTFVLFNAIWDHPIPNVWLESLPATSNIYYNPQRNVFVAKNKEKDRFSANFFGGDNYGAVMHDGRRPLTDRIYIDRSTGLAYRYDGRTLQPFTLTPGLSCQSRGKELYLHGAKKYLAAGLVPYLFRFTRKHNRYNNSPSDKKNSEPRRGWNLMGSFEAIQIDTITERVAFSTNRHALWGNHGVMDIGPYDYDARWLVSISGSIDKPKVAFGEKTIHMTTRNYRSNLIRYKESKWRRLVLPFGIAFGPLNDDPRRLMTISDMVSPLATFSLRNVGFDWIFGK